MDATVVIVDDRPTNLRIYAQFVKMMGAGFDTHCFNNPLHALDFLETKRADLLIVDYRMPEMSGAEFIRKVPSTSSCSCWRMPLRPVPCSPWG